MVCSKLTAKRDCKSGAQADVPPAIVKATAGDLAATLEGRTNGGSDLRQEIEAVIAAWAAAFNNGDPQGIASLYTADAMFIGGIGGVRHGPKEIAGYFEQNASPSNVAFRDIEIRPITDQVVVVSMIGAIGRPGGEARDFRFLQTHVRTEDGWRIAGHHGSASL